MSVVCVPNISEGRDRRQLQRLVTAAGPSLLDLHFDPDHNRSVFSLGGTSLYEDLCGLAWVVARDLDISRHSGVHPRLGALDVVPFVPLLPSDSDEAERLTAQFEEFLDKELSVPVFRYDQGVSLPEVRRRAFKSLAPTAGPSTPHPHLGATALACRPPLVAYNILVDAPTSLELRSLVLALRSPIVRTLGFHVAKGYQLSANLISPTLYGPYQLFQDVIAYGLRPLECELVGLLPSQVLATIPLELYEVLNVNSWSTFEARLSLTPSHNYEHDLPS